jgi:hypothetical protein
MHLIQPSGGTKIEAGYHYHYHFYSNSTRLLSLCCHSRLANQTLFSLVTSLFKMHKTKLWNLPQSTHCYLLPLLCDCLPVFDEICRRSINFARTCISHKVPLIRHEFMPLCMRAANRLLGRICCFAPRYITLR